MGVVLAYIFGGIFLLLGLVVLGWFFKNKPDGEVDTTSELFNTPMVLMTTKGKLIVVLVGLSFLSIGGFLLWVAIY
jgi:hypothetical protein